MLYDFDIGAETPLLWRGPFSVALWFYLDRSVLWIICKACGVIHLQVHGWPWARWLGKNVQLYGRRQEWNAHLRRVEEVFACASLSQRCQSSVCCKSRSFTASQTSAPEEPPTNSALKNISWCLSWFSHVLSKHDLHTNVKCTYLVIFWFSRYRKKY